MATLPTPEETGKNILAFYGQHNVRPGEMMLLRNLNIWSMKSGQRGEDLIAGLEWLEQQGYIEQKDGKSNDALFLTEVGFAAI